jgi:hypothetical protein
MPGATRRLSRSAGQKIPSMATSQSASDESSRARLKVPALLTRMSIRPNYWMA